MAEQVAVPAQLPLLALQNQVLLPSAIVRVSIPSSARKR